MNRSHRLTGSDKIREPTFHFTSEARVLLLHATKHSSILNCDRRLARKGFDERAFFICEQLGLLPSVEVNDTQHLTVGLHRDAEDRLNVMHDDALYGRQSWILTDIHRMHGLALGSPSDYRPTKRRKFLECEMFYAARTCNLQR